MAIMGITGTHLFIKGVLVLAAGEPVQFSGNTSNVWFSKPDALAPSILGSRLQLLPSTPGVYFASGLGQHFADVQKILTIDKENLNALKRCPDAASLSFPLELSENTTSKTLANCGFTNLSAPPTHAVAPELERLDALIGPLLLEPIARGEGLRRSITFSKDRRNQISKSLGGLAALYEFNLVETPKPGRTLIFHVTLFEFFKHKAQKLGLKLPQSIEGQTPWDKLALLPNPALATLGLDFGVSKGLSRILAQPTLRTLPGEKASFQSGGEIPIKNTSIHSSQTTWKSYGLLLSLEPDKSTNSGDREISLHFRVEISEPDLSTSIDGIPGMNVRKLESRFAIRTDEDTILSSMIQSRSGLEKAGPAGISEIPLLGRLFSQSKSSTHESELWFSVRPTWNEIARPKEQLYGSSH